MIKSFANKATTASTLDLWPHASPQFAGAWNGNASFPQGYHPYMIHITFHIFLMWHEGGAAPLRQREDSVNKISHLYVNFHEDWMIIRWDILTSAKYSSPD